MSKKMRPQLTLKIMFYALFDVLGMVILATGGAWFKTGKDLFITNFPTNAFEAIAAVVIGGAIMIWAAAQVLREMLKPPANEPEIKP
jgi:hypothetical protein